MFFGPGGWTRRFSEKTIYFRSAISQRRLLRLTKAPNRSARENGAIGKLPPHGHPGSVGAGVKLPKTKDNYTEDYRSQNISWVSESSVLWQSILSDYFSFSLSIPANTITPVVSGARCTPVSGSKPISARVPRTCLAVASATSWISMPEALRDARKE